MKSSELTFLSRNGNRKEKKTDLVPKTTEFIKSINQRSPLSLVIPCRQHISECGMVWSWTNSRKYLRILYTQSQLAPPWVHFQPRKHKKRIFSVDAMINFLVISVVWAIWWFWQKKMWMRKVQSLRVQRGNSWWKARIPLSHALQVN